MAELATSINLARNARVFVSSEKDPDPCKHNKDNTFEVNVLSDYSFSQESNSETISLNEAGCDINRGSQTFNTDLAPVDISLTTYIRPYLDADGNHRAVEEFLINGVISQYEEILGTAIDDGNLLGETIPMQQRNSGDAPEAGANSVRQVIDLSKSNVGELLNMHFYFKMDNVCYLVSGVQIETLDIAFDIEAIATMAFTGLGAAITKVDIELINAWTGDLNYVPVASVVTVPKEGDTNKPAEPLYLNNKLSDVRLLAKTGAYAGTYYSLPITGGNISFANNISFLVPEELSVVSKPVFGTTGAREITGELTAYLRSEGTSGTIDDPMYSGDLLDHLANDVESVSNEYALIISIAGCANRTPRLDLVIAHASLTVPTISTEDILSTSISFTAQGDNITIADELEFHYLSNEGTYPQTPLPSTSASILGPIPVKAMGVGSPTVTVTFDKSVDDISASPVDSNTIACLQGTGVTGATAITVNSTPIVVFDASTDPVDADLFSYFSNVELVDNADNTVKVNPFTVELDYIILKPTFKGDDALGDDIPTVTATTDITEYFIARHADAASDGDGSDPLVFELFGAEGASVIDSATGIISGIGSTVGAAAYVTATNGDGSATSNKFEINITVF